MLNFLYTQPTREDELKLQALLIAIEKYRDKLEACNTLEKRKGALLAIIQELPKGDLYKPCPKQLNTILEGYAPDAVECAVIPKLMAEQEQALKAPVKTALELSFALSALYFVPELFGYFAAKKMLQHLLKGYTTTWGMSGAEFGLSVVAHSAGYKFNQIDLMDKLLPETIANYNYFLRLPFHMAIGGVINSAVDRGFNALSYLFGSSLYQVGSGAYQVGRFFTDIAGLTEPTTPYFMGYMHQDSEYAENNLLDELFEEDAKPVTIQYAQAQKRLESQESFEGQTATHQTTSADAHLSVRL